MIINLIPQAITFEGYIEYSFIDEIIEVELKQYKDVYNDLFDFSGLPDGALDITAIETELPINPVFSATKTNGVLDITLLFWCHKDEEDERLLFPEPMTLEEFNELMEEIAERGKVVDDVEDWSEFNGENDVEK